MLKPTQELRPVEPLQIPAAAAAAAQETLYEPKSPLRDEEEANLKEAMRLSLLAQEEDEKRRRPSRDEVFATKRVAESADTTTAGKRPARACRICFEATQRNAAFVSCGHTQVCPPCAARLWQLKPECPWCRRHQKEAPIVLYEDLSD